MFILREVKGKTFHDGMQVNISLGDKYTFISKEKSPKAYETHLFDFGITDDPILTGLVIAENGRVFETHTQSQFFIMTDSGKTLTRL